MQILYFNQYEKAKDYSFNLINNDEFLIYTTGSFYTEVGECACINIEDDKFNVVYRLFYDSSLYELQDQFDKY